MNDDIKWEYLLAVHGGWHDLRGHLPFLYEAARTRQHPVVAEAGVRRGMSTRAFLAGGASVWSVDTAAADVPRIIRDHPRWHFLQADDLSEQAQEFFPAQVDMLFLDAHDDDWSWDEVRVHVLKELRMHVPRVRPGGLVLLHDTQWRAPDIDLGSPDGGVAAALGTYCEEAGLEWDNRPGFYGLGVMHIP